MKVDVGIVGAGLAGLSCARQLHGKGIESELFEAGDRVGGRVATDEVDGYLLDRGFQVLLSAYPEARRQLDLEALGARPFAAGSLVRAGGRFWRVADPWRSPLRGLATLRAPFVTAADALRMARLRRDAVRGGTGSELVSASALLRRRGFSEAIHDAFFRPFFGGVTLDRDLGIPAWFFLDLFGWFATGDAVLPARGMRGIPEQLAAPLPADSIRLGARVSAVTPTSIELASGTRVACRRVIVAADASAATRLLGGGASVKTSWSGTTTLHYGAGRSPVSEAILALNGEGPRAGPANHVCVPSDAQPTYAPSGKALVSVSVLGVPRESDEELDRAARDQLAGWYGSEVRGWTLLRVDRIPHALPRLRGRPAKAGEVDGVLVCGDHVATPSIQGALESGRRAAEAVAAALRSRAPTGARAR